MRNSRVVGFAIAGVLAVGTIAQAQSTTTQPRQQRHATKRDVRDGGGRSGLLRGITLSDAEKSQMKAVRTKYAAEAKSLRALRQAERAEVRSALTPEHQKVFDANAKTLERRRAEWSKNGRGERGRRAGRHGKHGVNRS
jgi:Spy/CpxP family protein refolding chaperone